MKKLEAGSEDVLYAFGRFVADPIRGLLRRDGETVALPPKAFEVLIALIERRGQIVEKEELLKVVWPNTSVEPNNLARHISTLRKTFHEGLNEHEYIVTIPGRGYRFVATLQELVRVRSAGAEEPLHPQPPVVAAVARSIPPSRALFGLVAVLLLVVSFTGTEALLPRSGERLGLPHRKLWQLTFNPGVQSEPTWSPDGRWIAYSSDRAGNSDIWVQPVDAENPVRVTTSEENDWQPAWSPDGRSLAFRSERDGGGLYVVPARGGTERKIADFGYRPQWSHDGSKILFFGPLRTASARSTTLFVVDLQGSPPHEVLADLLSSFQSFQAAWYPEGQRVSIYGIRNGSTVPTLWTVSLTGKDAVQSEIDPEVGLRIKEADVTFTHFVWSPAGDALFFEGVSQHVTNVWRVTVDPKALRWSAGPERLTVGAEINNNISLSSDGTRIAFSLRNETTRLWSLPFDAVGGRLTGPGEPLTAEGADAPYDISPDGKQLVYRALRQGKQELWKRSLVKGEDRLLLTAGAISAPRWSPDGARLVYRRDLPSELPGSRVDRTIAVMTADGSDEKILTAPRPMSASEQMAPFDWSADGARILTACPTGRPAKMGICLLTLNGGPDGEPESHVVASRPNHGLFEAQFSPDGRWICFNAVTTPGTSAVFVVPASGGQWTAVTDERFWGDKPRWSPDGRTIYFTLTRGGFVNVWGRRFDPVRGTPVADPFPVTKFEIPSRMLLPQVQQLHIALVHKRLILPLTDVSSSIWVLDNVNQ